MESTPQQSDVDATLDDSAAADVDGSGGPSAPEGHNPLEARLRAKEQLVAALTARLEQVAEQLDRVHRTGGDRAVKVSGGIPRELVDQQKTLVEDLQHALERWEDMQAEATLGRIEMQIGELRDLITSGQVFAPTHGAGKAATGHEAEDEPAGWEKLKASMLQHESPDSDDDETAGTDASRSTDSRGDEQDEEEIESVEAPSLLDLDSADEETLRAAVSQRDDYIAYLSKRLRIAQSRHRMPTDWEALANAPDELRQRLSLLVGTLEENLRLAEVEFSVERARLSRLESQLRVRNERLEKAMKRLGVTDDGEQTRTREQTEDDEQAKGSRWLRMLGIRKEEESDE